MAASTAAARRCSRCRMEADCARRSASTAWSSLAAASSLLAAAARQLLDADDGLACGLRPPVCCASGSAHAGCDSELVHAGLGLAGRAYVAASGGGAGMGATGWLPLALAPAAVQQHAPAVCCTKRPALPHADPGREAACDASALPGGTLNESIVVAVTGFVVAGALPFSASILAALARTVTS